MSNIFSQKCIPQGSAFLVVSIFFLAVALVGFGIYTMFNRQLCGDCLRIWAGPSDLNESALESTVSHKSILSAFYFISNIYFFFHCADIDISQSDMSSSTATMHTSFDLSSRTTSLPKGGDLQWSDSDDDKAHAGKKKSMAAISIAINYYQTVSALSQYPAEKRCR
jgi:hypothetical protein